MIDNVIWVSITKHGGAKRNVGRKQRPVVFSHGYIHYKRRIYCDEHGQRRKPLDELLGIENYQRSCQKVREMGSVLAYPFSRVVISINTGSEI